MNNKSYPLITKADARKGDHIRNEWDPSSEHVRLLSNEIIWSGRDGEWYNNALRHRLIFRPEPAVVLPIEPTLGWVDTAEEARSLGVWQKGAGGWLNATDTEGDESVRISGITAFIPATAVPTEALEALREYNMEVTEYRHVTAFLAAVDAHQ